MKWAGMYLVGFVVFAGGLLAALWKMGILDRIGATWTLIGVVIAIGLGIMIGIHFEDPDLVGMIFHVHRVQRQNTRTPGSTRTQASISSVAAALKLSSWVGSISSSARRT